MSIPKHERSPSKLEAQHMSRKINLDINTELARNFGFSEKKFEEHIEAITKAIPPGPDREQKVQQIREAEREFYLWLIDEERRIVHDLSRKIPLNLRGANSIWPNCQDEFNARRLKLDFAIAACNELQEELQYVAESIPADINRYTRIVLEIDKLVSYIKNLRKVRNNKQLDSLCSWSRRPVSPMSTATAMRTATMPPPSMAFGPSPVSDFATAHKRMSSERSSAKGKAVHSWEIP